MSADLALGGPTGLRRRDGTPVTDWPSLRAFVIGCASGICEICHLRAATDVDHVWPRRLGGEDHVANLRASCGPCNKAKGDRVDLATASDEQVLRALRALDARIADLTAERDTFEKELLVRAAMEGHMAPAVESYRLALWARWSDLDHRVKAWGEAERRIAASEPSEDA